MRDRRTNGPRRRGAAAGFTLIEVLVALLVLVLVLPPLLRIFSQGLTTTYASGDYAEAATVAESLLARAGATTPLVPGQDRGTQAGRYDWTLTIRPYTGDETVDARAPLALMEVVADVSWSRGPFSRSLTLKTLRLVPTEALPEP